MNSGSKMSDVDNYSSVGSSWLINSCSNMSDVNNEWATYSFVCSSSSTAVVIYPVWAIYSSVCRSCSTLAVICPMWITGGHNQEVNEFDPYFTQVAARCAFLFTLAAQRLPRRHGRLLLRGAHAEKPFPNRIKSNCNQIVSNIFLLILNQTDVRLVPNTVIKFFG